MFPTLMILSKKERSILEQKVVQREEQINDLAHMMSCTDPHCERCEDK